MALENEAPTKKHGENPQGKKLPDDNNKKNELWREIFQYLYYNTV